MHHLAITAEVAADAVQNIVVENSLQVFGINRHQRLGVMPGLLRITQAMPPGRGHDGKQPGVAAVGGGSE